MYTHTFSAATSLFFIMYIVGGMNIHSNGNIDLFTDMLECSLCKIRQSNTACIISGDIKHRSE